MSGDDERERLLAEMAGDKDVPVHLRLGALKAMRAPEPEARARPEDLDARMAELVPEPDGARGMKQDPMRDLDFELLAGREPHPVFLRYLRWVPPTMTRRELLGAEKTFLRAAREQGVDGAHVPVAPPGPAPARGRRADPDVDELTAQRLIRATRAQGWR